MKKYENYKDSGLEWLGMVPEHWEILPFKRGVSINNGRDYKHVQSEDGYPVIGSGGQFAFASDYLYDGEVILLGRKGTIDKPRYFNGKFWTVDTMFYAIPNQKCIAKYMYYQALTIPFSLYSTDTALPSMTQTDLGNHLMCFPPASEQRAIASYLDHKVGQIDAFISEKEKMVEDLKAYRSSLVTETVTKGLNKEVEMKDCGVEWIGKMPKNWKLLKLKRIVNLKSGTSLTSDRILDEGKYQVFGGNGPRGYIDDYTNEGNFVLIGRQGALCGNINYANGKFWATEHAIICYPLKEIDTIWLGETLRAMNLNQYSISAAQPGLAVERINELLIPTPSISEQKEISSYLKLKITQIESAISELEHQLSDLKSYKSSLITEAVTGKIDLRDWQTKKS